MEKMDTQSSRMSVNGYRSKMAFKTGGTQEPNSAGINQMMNNGIQDDEAEIGPIDDEMECQDQD